MNPIRDALIGKTITGVITRPGRDGLPELLMLALEDGSYMQFVMPQRRRRGATVTKAREALQPAENTTKAPFKAGTGGLMTQELPLFQAGCG